MDSDFEEDIEEEEEEDMNEEIDDSKNQMFLEDEALENPQIRKSKSFECLTEEGVRQRTAKLVKEIQEVCAVPRFAISPKKKKTKTFSSFSFFPLFFFVANQNPFPSSIFVINHSPLSKKFPISSLMETEWRLL